MTLTIHHATRLDHLVGGLGEVLNSAGLTPFEREIVAVPARGIQRWLDQTLSHHFHSTDEKRTPAGISAGIDYRSPRSLVELFLPSEDDPWNPRTLAWQILAVIDESDGQQWAQPLAQFKRGGSGNGFDPASQRYAAARRIADLFTTYASERPEMLRGWSRGEKTDGTHPLPPDSMWQVELFHALTSRIGTLPIASQIQDAVDAARESGASRFHTFGYTRLSRSEISFLDAASDYIDVHLWTPIPSRTEWELHAERGTRGGASERRNDTVDEPLVSPLLRTLGTQAGELAAQLAREFPEARVIPLDGVESTPTTLLERIQDDVRENLPPTRGLTLDDSVQIHSCHGPSRQVEVLREVLTELFEEDRELQPRDVLILCPDVDAYAPLLHAAFSGAQGGHPAARLRVQIADRHHSATNPLFDLTEMLLTLVRGRVRSSDLIDLLHREEIQRRFGVADSEVEMFTTWIKESGIRWGFDSRHRAYFDLDTAQNTVRAGLDRLLLGVPLADDSPLEGVLPYDEVGSTEIELLGVFAEFLTRLQAGITELETASTLTEWVSGLERLLDEISVAENWQESEFERALKHISLNGPIPASRADFLHMIEELGRPRMSPGNLRTGALTATSLAAVPAVPHKVVCLVGMDDGAFPRAATLDGDDVLARNPRVGERDPRYEDRQLFLDSLMSATSKFIVTFSGAGEQRGEDLYPAVPVAQLIDTVAGMVDDARTFVTQHPLHPFDHRYFDEGSGFVSFDARSAAAARRRGERKPPPPFLPTPRSATDAGTISLSDLHRFFADPVKHFIQNVAGVYLSDGGDPVPTEIPISPGHLDEWAIGNRLLTHSKEHGWAAPDLDSALLHGDLPPGELGGHELCPINETVLALSAAAAEHAQGRAHTVEIEVQVQESILLGRIHEIYGDTIVHVSYSNLAAKHRFAAWLDLLALTVQRPDQSWKAVVVGRDSKRAKTSALSGPEPAQARTYLAELFELYRKGVREPLPLPTKTSAAWATRVHKLGGIHTPAQRREVVSAAAKAWETTYDTHANEDQDRYQQLAWGGHLSFEDLLRIPAREDEKWNDEPSRLGQLGVRMWERMLNHEL